MVQRCHLGALKGHGEAGLEQGDGAGGSGWENTFCNQPAASHTVLYSPPGGQGAQWGFAGGVLSTAKRRGMRCTDKPIKCPHPGCLLAFWRHSECNRHQRMKHAKVLITKRPSGGRPLVGRVEIQVRDGEPSHTTPSPLLYGTVTESAAKTTDFQPTLQSPSASDGSVMSHIKSEADSNPYALAENAASSSVELETTIPVENE